MKRTTIVLAAAALLVACEAKKPEPAPAKTNATPKTTAPATAGTGTQPAAQPAPAAAKQQIGWTKPDKWKELTEKKPMRLHTYKIAGPDGAEEAEMSVSQARGSVDANVKRWEGQFKDAPKAKTEDKEVAGLKVTIVEIEGAMMVGGGPMMGGGGEPKEGYKMLAAMVHTQPSAYFFKMWGPKATVDGARGDFDALIASIGKK